MDKSANLKDRTLTIKKTLDAPVQLVWDAWTGPEHIAQWWGPKGMPVKVIKHDFEIGGKWKYSMPMPDGSEFVSEGEYAEIIDLQKIVTSADFKPMTTNVILEITFQEAGDQTIFTFNCIHTTVEYCQQQEKMGFYNGWGSTFERLEAYLIS